MLCTMYNHQEPWKVAATLYKGTIYLQEIETEEKRQQEAAMPEQQRATCYWGLKFEDYVTSKGIYPLLDDVILYYVKVNSLEALLRYSTTISSAVSITVCCMNNVCFPSPDPPSKAIPQSPRLAPGTVNPHRAFSSVVRTRMNSHSIVMVGEVDCYDHVRTGVVMIYFLCI